VVSTDWDDFKSPDFERLGQLMKARVLFDGRNLYRPAQMKERGFTYYSVGRAPVTAR
jgi:UDPglucose 6-dehydrogenase